MAKELLDHKLESIRAIRRAEEESARRPGQVPSRRGAHAPLCPLEAVSDPQQGQIRGISVPAGRLVRQAVPAGFGTQALKVAFPRAWAGAREDELPAISGIETLRFCHAGRFLITTGTEEDAITACETAMAFGER